MSNFFAHFNWGAILQTVSIIFGSTGLTYWLNKKFPFAAKIIKTIESDLGNVGPTIVADAQTLVNTVGTSAAAAVIEHHMKSEVDTLTAQLRQSELVRLALAGLHAFNLTLDSLSATQKTAIIETIKKEVAANWHVTDAQVESALTLAQQAATALSGTALFQSANTFTQAQTAKQSEQGAVLTQ